MAERLHGVAHGLANGLANGLEHLTAQLGGRLDDGFSGLSLGGAPLDLRRRDELLARMDEAADFYGRPAIAEALFAAPVPAEPKLSLRPSIRPLGDGQRVAMTWPTPWRALHPRYQQQLERSPLGRRCHALWLRHREPAPAVICLHGWGLGLPPVDAAIFKARWLYQQGLDVCLMVAPHHGARASRGRRFPPSFPHYLDPMRTTEGFAQAVAEIRGLLGFLLARGAPSVGVFGMSMGGFTAALLATVAPEACFAVCDIPFSSYPEMVWEDDGHGAASGAAAAAAETLGLDRPRFAAAFGAIDPLTRAPVIATERIVIAYGARDRVAAPAHALRLHAHFRGSRLVPFAGNHLLQTGRAVVFRAVVVAAAEPP